MRTDARGEGAEKLFFAVVDNRAMIVERSFSEFWKFFEIEISNFCRNQICEFREIENAKTFRARKTAKRNQGSTRADRCRSGKASRGSSRRRRPVGVPGRH
jgi:hypothetical protein